MSSEPTLSQLLGSANNLNEPMPNVNKRETILGVLITFVIISWTCGLCRLYARFFIIRSPGWDDFFLCWVMIFSLLGVCTVCIMPNYGLGQHFILLPAEMMEGYLKGFYVTSGSYVMSTTFIKISLLCQYLRIFKGRRLRRVCIGLIVIISLWGLAYAILAWTPCVPVQNFWDVTLADSEKICFGYGALHPAAFTAMFESHAGFNMAFDIIVLSLPMFMYFKPDTPIKARMGMLGLLFGGSLVVMISIWRLATLLQHKSTTYPTFDPSWYSPFSIVLSALEVDIASICASVPIFWPVFRDNINKIFITQEIQITYDEENGDKFELSRTRSGNVGGGLGLDFMNEPLGAQHGSTDAADKEGGIRTHVRSNSNNKELEP